MRNNYDIRSFAHEKYPIAAALDACRPDGGTVTIPAGTWPSGPLSVPSSTTMLLEKGAIVTFEDDPSLYPPAFTRWEGVECYGYRPLLQILDASSVRIAGEGIFDGSGQRWWNTYREIRKGELDPGTLPGVNEIKERNSGRGRASGGGGRETGFLRPSLFQVQSSRDVEIEGITFRNSPFWTAHMLYSRSLTITNCRFENPDDSPNTDGLNIDSSMDVTVSGCTFDVGDDCLCLKSGSDSDGRRVGRPVENVHVRDCVMNHGHGGVVFGSEISGGVQDIHIEQCTMYKTDRGIRIKNRRGRGGYVRNIRISGLKMVDVPYPLVANCYYRCGITDAELAVASSPAAMPVEETTPVVENISIDDVSAEGVVVGVTLIGLPESRIRDFSMGNWSIETEMGLSPDNPGIPAMDFSDTKVFVKGIYARNTEGLQVGTIRIDGGDIGPNQMDIMSGNRPSA